MSMLRVASYSSRSRTCRGLLLLLLFAASTWCLAGEAGSVGGWRLAQESSPYLRLHADNPVEWFPWGEEAFEKARKENKPLFISIGYFTCHWCHVMARESFSNAEIAGILNRYFVSIKVDREQRPDIDATYMNYVLVTRGQGGWPLSVWTTPDGKPFVGGTYFPPDASMGRAGMRQILTRINNLWQEDAEAMQKTGDRAVDMLRRLGNTATPLADLGEDTLVRAREQSRDSYDELLGGFSPAPKFPQPARLLFLLQEPEQADADMALHTLDQMAAGGIYDQLAGGMHRYSTDYEWRVPHFEKMLYDQALVARAYLLAYRRSGAQRHAERAREILDFSLSSLRDRAGGFYSALSADSHLDAAQSGHMEEGVYYTWTWSQLTDALGKGELRDLAAAHYGITRSGNALSDPLGELAGRNVLYQAEDIPALAGRYSVDQDTARRRVAEIRQRMLQARRQRPAPPVDDKIVSAWNGYMITTLALAGRLLDAPHYLEAAGKTAGFILDELYDDQTGVLYRDWRQGVRGGTGFAEDYAAVAQGLLALYKVSGDRRWLSPGRRLVDSLLEAYWDGEASGFFRTRSDTELWVREKEASDGATVSVNGLAIHVLLDLGRVTGEGHYADRARRTAAWAGAQLEESPSAMSYLLIRWREMMRDADPPRPLSDNAVP